jgi:hypothetical protein
VRQNNGVADSALKQPLAHAGKAQLAIKKIAF